MKQVPVVLLHRLLYTLYKKKPENVTIMLIPMIGVGTLKSNK
jgi:uncharacterized membrane protein